LAPYNIGVLLLVELSEERQVRRVEEAAMKLVEMLHNLSRTHSLVDLSEIESWRQSLTRQSQELSRREAEVAARQEQLQQWENRLREKLSS
jgi:RecA/RadA recombinase